LRKVKNNTTFLARMSPNLFSWKQVITCEVSPDHKTALVYCSLAMSHSVTRKVQYRSILE